MEGGCRKKIISLELNLLKVEMMQKKSGFEDSEVLKLQRGLGWSFEKSATGEKGKLRKE